MSRKKAAKAEADSGVFVGTEDQYQGNRTAGPDNEIKQRQLEHEELCRRVEPKRDWRGNVIEEDQAEQEPEADTPPDSPPADPE